MSKFKLLSSLLVCTFLLISTQAAKPITPKPHILQFLKIDDTTTPQIALVSSTCSYTVTIKTSCSSPKFTRDQISIAFGDADGQLVYAERIDDPSSMAFGSCSTDTRHLSGPCMSHVCSVYLCRVGSDGWMPESVTIERDSTQIISYNFNTTSLPNGVWSGFNHCSSPSSQSRISSGYFLLVLCVLLFALCVGGVM